MKKRLLLLVAAAAVGGTLAGCGATLERGPYRVWQPGDPDPGREEFYGPWSNGRAETVPDPASVGRPLR